MKCVSWNIIQFVRTIKFHSYDHVNVSFIDRINNFHFSFHRYYSFKSCLKILKIFKDFPKIFSECVLFVRDRRNTKLTKNITTAAPVTMNSTLDNAEVLDPLLKFMFKSWDVTQFIILLIIKRLLPITILLRFVLYCQHCIHLGEKKSGSVAEVSQKHIIINPNFNLLCNSWNVSRFLLSLNFRLWIFK